VTFLFVQLILQPKLSPRHCGSVLQAVIRTISLER